MNRLRSLLSALALILLASPACSDSGTGPGPESPSQAHVTITGDREASFTGDAITTSIQGIRQIAIGSTDGVHAVGFAGSHPLEPGTYAVVAESQFDNPVGTVQGVYGYTPRNGSLENYQATGGTLTIQEVSATRITGSFDYSAVSFTGTGTVRIRGQFSADRHR